MLGLGSEQLIIVANGFFMHRQLPVVLGKLKVPTNHVILVRNGFRVFSLASNWIRPVYHGLAELLVLLGAVDVLAQGLVDGLVLAEEVLFEGVGG